MNNIINIGEYKADKGDIFIFDTNVLIKIFYPTMGTKNSKAYITLYEDIVAKKATVYLSSIQVSEFVNRCIRFQFKLYKEEHPEVIDFKGDYRETDDYKICMEAVLEIVSDMLNSFVRINDNFDAMEVENLLKHGFSYDFNDALIAELSRRYNACLVTDDKDYTNFLKKLTIVTNNRSLLMFATKKGHRN